MKMNRRSMMVVLGSAGALAAAGNRRVLAQAKPMRIRGLFETPMEEPFVTQLHLAMTRAAKEDALDYKYSELVKAGDFSRVLREWCEDGVELIVGDAYGTEQICRRVAKDYPQTAFTMGSANGPTEPNFSSFYGQNYEPAYLAGMLAAKMSKAGKIGAVSGVASPTNWALLNAFRAGGKEVVPGVQFKAAYIGSFFELPRQRKRRSPWRTRASTWSLPSASA